MGFAQKLIRNAKVLAKWGVVWWSKGSPFTPTIQVQIHMTSSGLKCGPSLVSFSLFSSRSQYNDKFIAKFDLNWDTAITQWIHLHLPSCHPGFESKAHHLCFYHLRSILCYICHVKRTKINQKEAGFGSFLKLKFALVTPDRTFRLSIFICCVTKRRQMFTNAVSF